MEESQETMSVENQVDESSGNNTKSKTWIYVVIVLVLIFGFLTFRSFNNKQNDSRVDSMSNQTPNSEIVATSEANLSAISLNDIAKHSTKEDCWTTIDRNVYDVTKFISKHKGGDKILLACGKDASDMFNGKAPMSRVHSEIAKKILSGMKIGTLQN